MTVVVAQGEKGEKGDVGETGLPGRHGVNGIPGQMGEIGPQGLTGQKVCRLQYIGSLLMSFQNQVFKSEPEFGIGAPGCWWGK